ncbi:MAG: DUF3426 domain-containing protein [Hylemonella sp.]|nr:DUF3426 domain-containing protein [Hylemonella sp.]
MSLITRCPACRTMFKVVPDQLRISEGWVRCGKCEEIFDASAHMQDAVGQDGGVPAASAPDTVPFEGALASAMASETGAAALSPSGPAMGDPLIVDVDSKEPLVDMLLEPAEPSAGLLPQGSAYGEAGRAEPRFSAEAEPAHTMGAAAPSSAAELSFMRAATQTTRWHRPLVRATLLVACLLLGLGLALQVLVHERDYVATVEPRLKPLIEEACLLLGCQVEPLRQIESVVIDSSAFSKIKGDLYRLSLTLKNNAHFDLAMPAVELALTDTLDHALLRRVFQPEELGVNSGVIPAASETQTTLVLTIKTNGAGERVAGYRLLAFYP